MLVGVVSFLKASFSLLFFSRKCSFELSNDDLCFELQLCCRMCQVLFLMWAFGRLSPIKRAFVSWTKSLLLK
uniref:Uncharacterized protein n=1 Tax=Oryza punctata TaxID=4537 RepID=A0A0E0KFZ6_ORYPU